MSNHTIEVRLCHGSNVRFGNMPQVPARGEQVILRMDEGLVVFEVDTVRWCTLPSQKEWMAEIFLSRIRKIGP